MIGLMKGDTRSLYSSFYATSKGGPPPMLRQAPRGGGALCDGVHEYLSTSWSNVGS